MRLINTSKNNHDLKHCNLTDCPNNMSYGATVRASAANSLNAHRKPVR